MARVAQAVKDRYRALEQDPEKCFYCDNKPSMDDLTPSASASEQARDAFNQEWVRCRVCRTCWGKIYTANIANCGSKYGVMSGCMTLEMKQAHLGTAPAIHSTAMFSVGFGGKWIIPKDTMMMGEDFFVNNTKYTDFEFKALQPVFAMKILDRPREHVREALNAAYASGSLDMDDSDRYESLVGLQ